MPISSKEDFSQKESGRVADSAKDHVSQSEFSKCKFIDNDLDYKMMFSTSSMNQSGDFGGGVSLGANTVDFQRDPYQDDAILRDELHPIYQTQPSQGPSGEGYMLSQNRGSCSNLKRVAKEGSLFGDSGYYGCPDQPVWWFPGFWQMGQGSYQVQNRCHALHVRAWCSHLH